MRLVSVTSGYISCQSAPIFGSGNHFPIAFMRSPFNAVSLMCLCVWHAAASAQSVDGEWRGRLECSDFLAGVQGPANSAGPFGYGITVNLSSGVVDGSRGTNTVEEKFTGSSDGRRMRFLVDGKRKDRPAWWTINLAGPVRDGTAKLEGQMLNRPGTPIRNCALTLVSSEYRTTLEAEFAAKQRAIARERREAELIEENSKLRAAPAESERMVREAVAAAEATRRAEQKSVEDRSAGDTGSSIGPPAPPKRVVRQQPQTTPRPVPQDGKAVLDPPRRADAKTPAMDASPPIENAAAVDRSATAKAAADKAAAEKSASDKAATDKAAAEKASADKASVERAAVLEKATAEKMAAERVAAEKAAAERAAAEKGKKQPIRVRNSMDL